MEEDAHPAQVEDAVAQQDQSAVARLQAGDDTGLDELMGRYKKPLVNFIYRMIGDPAEAEDIAQLVFVRVYQRIGTYHPHGRFTTWLFAIAHHAAIDHLRWQSRHRTESLERDEPAPSLTATGPDDVVENVTANETARLVAAAIRELPQDQREVVILSCYHGHSYAEIARIMRCTVKSVESRLYRARGTLRHRLDRLMDEQGTPP